MLTNKTIQHKRGTPSSWEQEAGYIPLDGELIIYRGESKPTHIKVGDGETTVSALPFCGDGLSEEEIESIVEEYLKDNPPIGGNITIENDYKPESTDAISGQGVADALQEFRLDFKLDLIKDLTIGKNTTVLTFQFNEDSDNNIVTFFGISGASDQDIYIYWEGAGEIELLVGGEYLSHRYQKAGTYTCHIFNLKAISSSNFLTQGKDNLIKAEFGYFCQHFGSYCFNACANLKEITFLHPNSILDNGAFGNCTSLQAFTLPVGYTNTIPYDAFTGCTQLKTIHIHKDFVSYPSAFNGWTLSTLTGLEEYDVDSDNPYFISVDGALYDKNQTILYAYPSGKKPSDGTLKLSNIQIKFLYGNAHIKKLILNNISFASNPMQPIGYLNNLEELIIQGDEFNYTNLTSNTIFGESVGYNLQKIIINPSQLCEFSSTPNWFSGLGSYGKSASLTFGKNVLSLPKMGASLTYINEIIFEDNEDQPLYIPTGSLQQIGVTTLRLPKRTLITFSNGAITCGWANTLTKLEFNCPCALAPTNFGSNLKEITAPNLDIWFNMRVAGNTSSIFYSCPNAKLYIGTNSAPLTKITEDNFPSQITQIPASLFYNYDALEEVSLPSGVTSIGSYAFHNKNLTTVYIPSTVINIGAWAFREHENLTITCDFAQCPSTWSINWIEGPGNLAEIIWAQATMEDYTAPAMASTWSLRPSEPDTEIFYGNIQVNNDIIVTYNDEQYSLTKILELLGGYFEEAKI